MHIFIMAEWLHEEDKDIFVLTEAYYTDPIEYYDGWELVNKTHRVGTYKKAGNYLIVCKGTTPTEAQDLADDLVIGNVLQGQITIDDEVRFASERLPSNASVVYAGHSLGGRSAMTVAAETGQRAVVFNPAAPFNNPLVKGPGVERGRVYKISGDLISSNVSPEAGELIVVNQGYTFLQTPEAHAMVNFSGSVPTKSFYSVDQEDAYLTTTLAYASTLAFENNIKSPKTPFWSLISSVPLLGSARSQRSQDSLNILNTPKGALGSFERYGFSPVVKLANDKVQLPRGLKNEKDINREVSKAGFFNTSSSYSLIKEAVAQLNNQSTDILGYQTNLNPTDVIMTSTTDKVTPQDVKYQQIGLTDDRLSRLLFSAQTPNPEAYLEEASEKLTSTSADLERLYAARVKESLKGVEVEPTLTPSTLVGSIDTAGIHNTVSKNVFNTYPVYKPPDPTIFSLTSSPLSRLLPMF